MSSLFVKNCESIHDEQGTTNREIVAKHLDMGILAYVLSSRKTKMNKYADFVRNTLPKRDLLEQLAEECNELAKASLKLIRANEMSENVTPTSKMDAYSNFIEEQKDVISVLWLLTRDENYKFIDNYEKYVRWAKRLGYKE